MKIRTIIAATCAALAFSMAGPIYAHDSEAQTVTKNFEAAIPNIPGKSLLAVAQNPDAARLMGIDVSRAIALAYAISTVFAGIGGILIAPLFNVSSDMGTLFGIKAFAVAIVGGITSASGVVVAGLLYGVVEALVATLLGSTYTQIITFAFVIAALAFLPNGLLGQAGVKKV